MAAPRIGYLLPTRDWTILGGDVAALAEQARAAEDLGFDSVWAGDSPVTRPRASWRTSSPPWTPCQEDG
ncbi:LLM class flavin-dependent oxidoreductase [Nonomuraea pusilla]|uniref:Luciferase-like monooxygenase n=1 Tax=Nonomuraea pusilla TaxID=46177 RepID=A0A1H8GAR7_9ACTN|nr:LLM class flavin-dependent oxidoreductase [Nonomuraea pusilla]SEN41092.1 Luciferase-like monooxygenase [Nonomuraea pusilla]